MNEDFIALPVYYWLYCDHCDAEHYIHEDSDECPECGEEGSSL